MARFLTALLAAALVATVQAGGQAAPEPSMSEVFWRTLLPDSPLPDSIRHLLLPAADTSSFEFYHKAASTNQARERIAGSNDFNYMYKNAGEQTAVGDTANGPLKNMAARTSQAGERIASSNDFNYMYKNAGEQTAVGATANGPFKNMAPSTNQAQTGERIGSSNDFNYLYNTAPANSHMLHTTVFFHEKAVRVGERLPFHFPAASPATQGFLPRHVADSIPFTTPALPGVLAALGIKPDSAMASSMEATLRTCEARAMAGGESMFCATSLEALLERAMEVLGTSDIRPVTSMLPRTGAPLQTYIVRAVRPVEGGPVFVACHDEAYPYTVYRCHTTGPSRAYMVEMEGARGGGAVSIATVCHTDTSTWNPEHISFRLLGTKPGGTPVCHLMPYGHIIWAKSVKRATA